jgi:hypothetical protein
MKKIEQYSTVRVKSLIDSSIDRDGWKLNKRPPVQGDIGAVTDILQASGLAARYVVESTDAATGTIIWLSDFAIEELELV